MTDFIDLIRRPRDLFAALLQHPGLRFISRMIPDSFFLKMLYYCRMGKSLNLKDPKLFSEKLQWLKLNDRNPLYTKLVDKYSVKDYVASILGHDFIIPTLGVWDRVEDINFSELPDKFVIKCTHDSGGLVICRGKSCFDIESCKKKLQACLKNDYYAATKEWPYKNVPRRIIAEQYIDPLPETEDLPDYKFFCFNGVPKYCQVISGRGTKMCIDFFDHEWNHQPFHEPCDYPFANKEPLKPQNFNKMWEAAAKLAKDKAFSRIDFYDVGTNVYFGEITFFPTSGMGGK